MMYMHLLPCLCANLAFNGFGKCARADQVGCAGNSLVAALQPSSDSNCSFLSYAWDNDYSCYAAQVILLMCWCS